MSDVLQRLNAIAEWDFGKTGLRQLARDAVNEIERLRGELDAAKWWADKHDICWNDLIGDGDE